MLVGMNAILSGMSLISRIITALDAGVDPGTFECCAVALMMKAYKNVVPVEGGSDGGRDADIYGPIAGDPDSRGRILVTTGDSLDNLKSSHKTWQGFWESGEPFRVDQLVIVTSNPLSDAKRRNILKYCRDHELPIPTFYTRQWLVEELRKDDEWRAELTGVRGRLEAIVATPSEAVSDHRLVGRDDDLDYLHTAVALAKDVCLIGLPGVGKTRLLAELTEEVHFVEPLAREFLTDDLVASDPRVVVLDDAHLQLPLLEELVRIRGREQLRFRVIAASWPGSEGNVEALLADPTPVDLDRLARPELDELVQQLGVHGVRARAVVLNQSDGRPGWAVLLSRLVVDGDGEALSTGQPLLDQVSSLTHSISGSAALADALACIAALGTASLEDLELVADLTDVRYADLIEWLEATAQGGLVERTREQWTVLGPLGTLTVASTFFGERKRRRWATLATRFPHDHRLDQTILEVASTAPSTEVRELADAWFAHAAADAPDADMLALVELYGQIDEHTADKAAALARRVIGGHREPEILYGGIAYDPIGVAAESVLRASFRRTCTREATHGLLDLAIGDDRPRHQHPEHPMRVIQEIAQYLDPDVGPLDVLRERILTHALDWFDEAPSDVRWCVLAEAARYIFDPDLEGNWTGPGSHLTLTMARGRMSPGAMAALLVLWQEIDARVRSDAGAHLTLAGVVHLCEIFRVWSSLAAGEGSGAEDSNESGGAVGVEGATLVLGTLASLVDRFPAVPIAVNRQLELVAVWSRGAAPFVDLPIVDDRLARFLGVRDHDDEIEAWMLQRNTERTSLALELAGLGATEGVAEYRRLQREASLLDGSSEGALLAGHLADAVSDAADWLRVAVAEQIPELVGAMLPRARSGGLEVADVVGTALEVPTLRASVLRVFLYEEGELDSLARSVIDELGDGDVAMIGELWVREPGTPMLRELLVHPRPDVRTLAAVTFRVGLDYGPDLPNDLRPAWRAALAGADPSHVSQHARWRLQKMLKYAVVSDPALCADWFIANAATMRAAVRAGRVAESISQILRDLPREEKQRVCTSLSKDNLSASGFAAEFLATDESLVDELLSNGFIDVNTLLGAMSGYRDYTVEGLAPALVQAGVSPERIADRALSSRRWTGSEAASIRKDLRFFSALREQRPELAEVCAAAASRLERELERATVEENQERLLGW